MPLISMPPHIVDEHLNLLCERLNRGSAMPRPELRVYSAGGPQSGTLLAVLHFYLPAFTPANNGRVVANPITPCNSCLATGKAESFVAVGMDGTPVFMGTVGLAPERDRYGNYPPSPHALVLEGSDCITAGSVLSIDYWEICWGQNG